MIADLGAEGAATRRRALEELTRLGEAAEPALRKALAAGPDVEVKLRLHALLSRLGEPGRSPAVP